MTRVLVAFGSNIDPGRNVVEAAKALAAKVRILRISRIYETPPVDAPGSPPFVNGIVEIETDLSVDALRRDVLRGVESACGRNRTADPNASRPIDLDLVRYGDAPFEGTGLADHVAIPLADLIPEKVRPSRERRDFKRRGDLEDRLGEVVPDAGRPSRPEV